MKAWQFLEKHKWTRHWLARNKNRTPTQVNSTDAVSFCIEGVLRRVYGSFEDFAVAEKKVRAICPDYVEWNNRVCKSKRQAVALLKKADV